MATLLILGGANVSLANNEGMTALDVARSLGQAEIEKVLSVSEEVQTWHVAECTEAQKILFCTLLHCKICLNL